MNLQDLPDFGWVDLALLAVLALSIAVGLWRGLVFEVLSLIGWVVAYIVAQAYGTMVAGYLPVGTAGGAANHAAGFVAVFIGSLIVWALATRLLRLLIHATPLQGIDRVLGGGFGLLRGGVLLLAVATVVSMTPAARSPAWQHSVGAAWLGVVLSEIKPMLPQSLGRHLPV